MLRRVLLAFAVLAAVGGSVAGYSALRALPALADGGCSTPTC